MKKTKIFFEFFHVTFQAKLFQQFYFGRKQKYIWKRFCSIKRPVNNRATERPTLYLIFPVIVIVILAMFTF
jgi:hypothetical protein